MIGRLKGIVVHKQPPWLVVDVNGVGYELEAPMSTFYDLPEVKLQADAADALAVALTHAHMSATAERTGVSVAMLRRR